MAGEVKGKIYEAITKVALEIAIKGNKRGWKVLWHEQPAWVTIEADLAIGKDKESIEALFMVTHSTSEKLSEKKFWRNYGELFQWKVQGPKPVLCYDILFDASFKPELLKINESFTDSTLIVSTKHYGKVIVDYVNRYKKEFGNSDETRVRHAETLLKSSKSDDVNLTGAIEEYASDLGLMLGQVNKKILELWNILRPLDISRHIAEPHRMIIVVTISKK